jgi:peptidyl-prolyl cis-trans isomerase SurA
MVTIKNREKWAIGAVASGVTAIVFLLLIAAPVQAQQIIQKIEALVNDEVISAFDVRQRLGLVIAASGGVSTQDELVRLQEQVLRTLVDERLQIQEAREFEVEIPDEEIDAAYSRIVQSFNQTLDTFDDFLAQFGAAKKTLVSQLYAEFAWQTLVRGRLGQQIGVTDEEVEAQIARMERNTGKYEYRVSEIYLIVGSPSDDARVKATIEELAKQITESGAAFNLVARQFSEAASAARGGDLGWLSAEQMQSEVAAVITNIDVRIVSEPVRTAGGYRILTLTDRRRILSLDPLDTLLDLHHVMFPFTQETTQEEADAWIAKSVEESKKIKGCDDIEALAKALEVETFGKLRELPLRSLRPELRDLLDAVEDGFPTEASASQEGIRIFFVCGRREPVIGPPDFDDIYLQLQEQRLSMVARRYLRDLRRDSIVDYR